MRHSTTLLLIIFAIVFMLLTWPDTSNAVTSRAPHRLHALANQPNPPKRGTIEKRAWVVCKIFKNAACHNAINVAYCESHLNPQATNGTYKGIFQLGTSERHRYGHGRTTWKQAQAAYTYYQLAGWSPWACKP